MKVLIIGGGFINKGAEAMVKTVQAQIAQRLPGTTFHFSGAADGEARFLAGEGIQVLPARPRKDKIAALGRMLSGHPGLARDLPRQRRLRTLATLADVDAVLDISGYAYGDPWGMAYSGPATAMAAYAQDLGKPFVLLPQAFGPFERPNIAASCRQLCARAALTFVRDEASMAHLRALFGGPLPETIRMSPDIAFLFDSAPLNADSPLLRTLDAGRGTRPLAGIAPNMRVYERTPGTGLDNEYVRLLIRVAAMLVEHGYAVALVPHEVSRTDMGTTDDRLLCSIIEAGAGTGHVRALTGCMSAVEIKAVIGQMRFLIGSRFHALVAALSQGIPVFAVSWSHKYQELLALFGLERHVLGADALQSLPQAAGLIQGFVEEAENLSGKVRSALPGIQQSVSETFDAVASTLVSHK